MADLASTYITLQGLLSMLGIAYSEKDKIAELVQRFDLTPDNMNVKLEDIAKITVIKSISNEIKGYYMEEQTTTIDEFNPANPPISGTMNETESGIIGIPINPSIVDGNLVLERGVKDKDGNNKNVFDGFMTLEEAGASVASTLGIDFSKEYFENSGNIWKSELIEAIDEAVFKAKTIIKGGFNGYRTFVEKIENGVKVYLDEEAMALLSLYNDRNLKVYPQLVPQTISGYTPVSPVLIEEIRADNAYAGRWFPPPFFKISENEETGLSNYAIMMSSNSRITDIPFKIVRWKSESGSMKLYLVTTDSRIANIPVVNTYVRASSLKDVEDGNIDYLPSINPQGKFTSATVNGQTVYYHSLSQTTSLEDYYTVRSATQTQADKNNAYLRYLLWMIGYGEYILESFGIALQPDANHVTFPVGASIDVVKEAINSLVGDDYVYVDVLNPDGTITRTRYNAIAVTDVISGANTTQKNPAVTLDSLAGLQAGVVDIAVTKPNANPSGGNKGNTPSFVFPSGSAGALFSTYYLTNKQVSQFGQWLWSSNIWEQLKKFFSDPIQAIISLHKIYAPPLIGEDTAIKIGYITSEVTAKEIVNQYTSVHCGSVNLLEYFGNVFDYLNTKIEIFLPFIGVVELEVSEVMNSTLDVVYHVDVLTGTFICEILVNKGYTSAVLYQYTGDCSVHYPLSSGSYLGIVSSLMSVASSVVGAIASKGASLMAGGLPNISGRTSIQRSGNLTGNAGAMGGKIPYLIITRNFTAMPNDYPSFIGQPLNFSYTLSNLKGFNRFKISHVENVRNALKSELDQIESILNSGVIIR